MWSELEGASKLGTCFEIILSLPAAKPEQGFKTHLCLSSPPNVPSQPFDCAVGSQLGLFPFFLQHHPSEPHHGHFP